MKKGKLLLATTLVAGTVLGYCYRDELLKIIPINKKPVPKSEIKNIPVYIRETKTKGEGL
ncbi:MULTISPECIES: hypothetical protein [Lactococcus]|jgi:hypothetical protein|uniref:Uncharacterized protein n=1 Tax=Lactococcus lactis subsp. lactis TaxID=1360 RepID=A0A0V8BRZ1_LACLL|nr:MULTISPECIES: hypothetical protein [Lactococcus]MCO4468095.1 hypothetical protein [Streptococcus infantarius subsp. infantarius]KST91408.1 hypothetical protein LKF24_1810 [Lactococcus lactis subsp. lactis]KSU06613.1 hypothetical protein KF282_0946 [Lactococcus lactis subsp. lactis]MBK0082591.1 hypothetical protein [Lactococcus sp. S64]MBN2937851.1 hypothetical protein [Lactococcus lactis]